MTRTRRRKGTRQTRASKWALLAVLLVTLIAMVTFDRPLVVGDGLAYLIWLDSIALDGDLDLANQAAKFAAVNTYHIYLNPETGRWASAFPLGVAFLLTPFYWLGSRLDMLPALRINDAHFVGIQGVPLAYSLCIMIGINVYTLLMVGIGYGIARRFARPWAAAASAIAIYLGTPLFFYTSVEPLNSHIAGGFAATLFTFLWLCVRDRPRAHTWQEALGWLWVGLAAGLTALCRWQVALIALPVGLEVLLRRRWREVIVLGIGFAALAWIIPYSWWRMYGSPVLIPATQGDQSAVLIAPVNTLHVLFSPIAGLFPWSPIAALALVGLVPLSRRDGWLAASAAVMFLSQALVCGAVKNWWAGTGFGMRRMAELYPVYLFLLASLLGSAGVGLTRANPVAPHSSSREHRSPVGVGLMRPGPVATHPPSGEHGGLGEHGGSPLRLFPFRRGLAVLVLVLTVVLALYGVAVVLARLNFTWTNPWGLARDTPVVEMAYTFSREHWPLMWPVIKDHVGPWAWAKPGP